MYNLFVEGFANEEFLTWATCLNLYNGNKLQRYDDGWVVRGVLYT